jgi:hypothetical protein
MVCNLIVTIIILNSDINFMLIDQSSYYCLHHVKYIEMVRDGEQLHSSEYEEANEIDQQIIADLNNEDMCNVYRSELGKYQKNRSFGLLVTFLSCNVVIVFVESIKSKGCRRITVKIIEICQYFIVYYFHYRIIC